MKLSSEALKNLTNDLIQWIKDSMVKNGGDKAVIGISGGKDSSVVAALCVRALGKENVIGVLMPDGIQHDISDSKEICKVLEIESIEVNIEEMTKSFLHALKDIDKGLIPDVSKQTKLNLPPRVRMTLLYAISQSIDKSRVINTSNISEDWIGYATIYGDTAGAFSPLGMLTSDEVIQVGEFLEIPSKFIIKKPSDGLTGKVDEEVFGFSYEVLNNYIREGICEDEDIKEKIDSMHKYSRHKFLPIPMFNAALPIKAQDIANIYK
ncbi:NAD(+) synthase [Tissierella sp.]|uniref:NAD(+) synthase n=1 Tax=Tissierella sp. TaxID=41274 RepID=UPI002857C979|nr:NAD(+) synthase [Tissierella sp.]MDR7856637.1 NAD(+) synthase [Tissierella sp.]